MPLGIPLIMGPAAITSILVSREAYGYLPTLAALIANMALVFLSCLRPAPSAASSAPRSAAPIAKVASLFLAAISVAMIRAGVVGMVKALR